MKNRSSPSSLLSGHALHYSQSPPSRSLPRSPHQDVWHYDELNETSVMGAHFAQAVAIISSGHAEDITKANSKKPCRKVFFEEARYNPALANSHISHECDAHFREQGKAWRKSGTIFPTAKREYVVPEPRHFKKKGFDHDTGVVVFERNRERLPFNRRKKLLTQSMLHDTSLIKAQEQRTAVIGPTTYATPDPWKEKFKPVCGVLSESSIFKSKVPRFADPPPSRQRSRPLSPPATASVTAHPTMRSSMLSMPAIPTMVGASHSLDGLDSWDSLAFDQVGENGSFSHLHPSSSPSAYPYHALQGRPSSRPTTSPDLVITSLHPASSEVQDAFHRSETILSRPTSQRSRSANLLRGRLPGPSFGGHQAYESSAISSMESLSGGMDIQISQDLAMDVIALGSPPRGEGGRASTGFSQGAAAAQAETSPSRPQSKGKANRVPQETTTPPRDKETTAPHTRSGLPHEAQAKQEDSLVDPSGSLSAITSGGQSYHRTLLARWNPPLCYSKKPLHEQIIQEQRALRWQKLADQQDQREMIQSILSHASASIYPSAGEQPQDGVRGDEVWLPANKPFSEGEMRGLSSRTGPRREPLARRPHTTADSRYGRHR